MAAETGFIIDGTRYEVPTLDTFTMDEAQILYDYSRLTIEDFVPLAAETEEEQDLVADARQQLDEKLRNPGFLRALMHIAYQRSHPHLSMPRVKQMIGAADLVRNFDALLNVEDDAGPPDSMTEPNEPSNKNSVSSNESSGQDSTKSSAIPDDQPELITTTGSDTSLASHLTSSAA